MPPDERNRLRHMLEAAVHVSSQSRKRMPEIPWQNIIDMRNVLIHVYHDVDVNIVWDTITEDLPPLVEQLKKIVPPGDP